MKYRTPALVALAIVLIATFWLLQQPKADKLDKTQIATESNKRANDSPPPSKVASLATDAANAEAVSKPQDQAAADLKWVSQHDAGITISQSFEDRDYHPGTITDGKLVATLGESPPRYHYQLKGGKFTVLLGEEDNRHGYNRTVGIVHRKDGISPPLGQLSVTWTKSAPTIGAGGFVFRRDENDVSQIGIIVPDITSPPDTPEESAEFNYVAWVRLQDPARDLDPAVLKALRPEPLDENLVVIMATPYVRMPEPQPKTARILWLRITDTGTLEIQEPLPK